MDKVGLARIIKSYLQVKYGGCLISPTMVKSMREDLMRMIPPFMKEFELIDMTYDFDNNRIVGTIGLPAICNVGSKLDK